MTRAANPPNSTPPATGSTPALRRGGGDAIDHWLRMFTRFLRLPHEQSRAINDELDSHMRERVRDLMLEGLSEDEGMRRAIDELGEAAELAAHFRAAHQPNRRMLMSIAAIGVAAGAAVISVVALTQSQPATATPPKADNAIVAARQAEAIRSVEGVPVLSEIPIVASLFSSRAAPPTEAPSVPDLLGTVRINADLKATNFREIVELIAKEAGMKLSLQADPGFDTRAKIDSIQFVDADLATAFRRLNYTLNNLSGPSRVDFRVRGDVLEVAPRQDFDRRETTLIAYDLTDAFRSEANVDGLVDTVTQFVETDGWHSNGGETARLKVVGNKMFVEAPPRYHERIAWILGQFSTPKGASSRGGASSNLVAARAGSPFGSTPGVAPAAPSPANATGGSRMHAAAAPAAEGGSPFGASGMPAPAAPNALAAPAVAPAAPSVDPVSPAPTPAAKP